MRNWRQFGVRKLFNWLVDLINDIDSAVPSNRLHFAGETLQKFLGARDQSFLARLLLSRGSLWRLPNFNELGLGSADVQLGARLGNLFGG